ncbi:NAD-dependent epimerase [Paenibacillus swuensis]|uniref:NAD-dependent epimerase n=1 Tax=Paenibacillus swuensis TaxID=1178515 RepID=A0A172TMX7_9BACL|nr:TIGR01777 family oxidoreductase [Paenibacillus swuensis]ANE48401.1 NAD-dependent epimerase [Paenibacillus swuensis]
MNRKIVLAGGTGFVGRFLEQKFRELQDVVKIISRGNGHISWSDRRSIIDALDGADVVINLAGKSVDCRYNEKNKREIVSSRVDTTQALGDAIKACAKPPALWMNASTATIYRHAEDRPMTEDNGELGTGFSVDVAKAWEEAFFSCRVPGVRQAALRMAIVLGRDGGVIGPYRNLVNFGLGGVQGSGRQMFSWIHIEDVFRIVQFIMEHKTLNGVFNCSSPHPVMNQEFMKQLRVAAGVRVGLPSPRWLLEIGAMLIRTETELILKSRWVVPERLSVKGFTFRYGKLEDALGEIWRS